MPNIFEVLAGGLSNAARENSIRNTLADPRVRLANPDPNAGPPQGYLAKMLGFGGDPQPQPAPVDTGALPAGGYLAPLMPSSSAMPAGSPSVVSASDLSAAKPIGASPVPMPTFAAPLPYAPAAPQMAPQPQPQQSPIGGNGAAGGPLPSMAALQGAPTGTGFNNLFGGVEKRFNLPAGYLSQTASIESGGDPNAVSPTGAKGLFQFTKGTAAQYGLSDPTNVVASTFAAGKLASDNAQVLRNALGRDPTAGELYLAHQQGAGTAAALLANPNAPAGQVLASIGVNPRNIRVNGGDPNMPAGAFAAKWMSKFGAPGNLGGAPPQMASASPFGGLSADLQAGASLPMMAVNPQAAALLPSTRFASAIPPGGQMGASSTGQPVPIDANGNALGYSPPGASSAPASRAIAGAIRVPGYDGSFTRDQANDGDGVPSQSEWDAAARRQGVGGVAGPGAPGSLPPVLPGRMAPAYLANSTPAPASPPLNGQIIPPGAPLPQGGIQSPTFNPDALRVLTSNPDTRELGLKLWAQMATGKNHGFLQTPNGDIVATDPTTGTAVLVYQGNKLQSVAAGTSLYDPASRQVVYTAPEVDKSKVDARPLTAEEKAAYGLPPGGSYELAGGKVMAVPGTYGEKGGVGGNHVIGPGGALVDAQGRPLYTNSAGQAATMDQDTIESLARRVYLGDTTALVGLGRGSQGAANIAAIQGRAAQIAKENQGKEKPVVPESDMLANRADQMGEQAGARASGTLNARLDTYANEASGAMGLGIQASRAVPRTTWTPLNRAVQAVQTGSGDPQLAAFVAANTAIINTYAKAINPNGTPTVSDKAHASEILSTAQSPEAYEATIRQLQREINIAHTAARGTRAAERSGAAGQDMAVTPNDPSAPGASSVPLSTVVSGAAQAGSQAAPRVQVRNAADFDALRPGTRFIDPDGKARIKP